MDYNAPLPPPPTDNFLEWIANNPEEFSAYLHRVYALSQLTIVIVSGGVTSRFPIKFSETNSLIEIVV